MQLRIFTEPQQGASYDQLPRAVKADQAVAGSAPFRACKQMGYLESCQRDLP